MIELQCTSCGTRLRVSDDNAGRKGQCSECQAPISIPAVVVSTYSVEPRLTNEKQPSKSTPASGQAPSNSTLEALRSVCSDAEQDHKTPPNSQSPPGRHSRATGNIDANDDIPIAKPAQNYPLWLKAAVAAVVLLVLVVLLTLIMSSADKEFKTYHHARVLLNKANDLSRPARVNRIRGAAIGQLFDWNEQLQEATGLLADIQALSAEDPDEVKLLTTLQEQSEPDTRSISKMSEEIQNELWPVTKANDKPREMFQRVSSSVPIVQHATVSGSGFLLEHAGELWVATNRHVVYVTKESGLELVFMLGEPDNPNRVSVPVSRTAAIGAIYKHSDLAIIKLPNLRWFKDLIRKKQVRPLNLRPKTVSSDNGALPTRTLARTDEIWTVGHPGNHVPLTITLGKISGITAKYSRKEIEYGKVIQISAEITHGSSGGPVFDRRGHVVGVATFGVPIGTKKHAKFAIHVDELWKLLTDPSTRYTVGEIDRMIKVAATYKLHRMIMRKNGWLQCGSLKGKPKPERDNTNERWINYRIGAFEAMARTQYAVTVVSDPQHKIELLVVYPKGAPDQDGRRQPELKQAVGSGVLRINLELKDRADLIIKVLDPSDSKKDWPVHVDVFRRASPATTPKQN